MNKTVEEIKNRFADMGIIAWYGGGAKHKGNGFWLSATTPDLARAYWADIRAGLPKGRVSLTNDGIKSGNEFFWMRPDALALLREMEREAQHEHPPELTPQDDAALDRAWDSLTLNCTA